MYPIRIAYRSSNSSWSGELQWHTTSSSLCTAAKQATTSLFLRGRALSFMAIIRDRSPSVHAAKSFR
jgi:hypothetical protein